MTSARITGGTVCLALVLMLLGCGDAAPTAAETAPFGKAVAAHLAAKSMDMKVAEFKSLSVDGDTAAATCSMEEASGLYGGVKVRWTFTFGKDGAGAWKVTGLEK